MARGQQDARRIPLAAPPGSIGIAVEDCAAERPFVERARQRFDAAGALQRPGGAQHMRRQVALVLNRRQEIARRRCRPRRNEMAL